jgi:hypothetical protein
MSRPARILVLVAGIVVAVAVLFTVVFPWVSRTLVDDPTLDPPPADTSG